MMDSPLKPLPDRRVEEQRMQREGRLPPGQSLTQKFPVLHNGPVPPFDPKTWDFRIYGQVQAEVRWSWDDFQALPHTRVSMDLHCVTRWSKFDTGWEGVSMKTLIERGYFKPAPAARYVIQHAEYGYTANLPLEIVLQENFLLATHYEGQPIPADHGFPVRGLIGHITGRNDLVTPYLWKGAKWLRTLEFTSQDRKGYWERAGYHNEADVWKEERFG